MSGEAVVFIVFLAPLLFIGAGMSLCVSQILTLPSRNLRIKPETDSDILAALDLVPFTIWSEANGKVLWSNKRYADLTRNLQVQGLEAFEALSNTSANDLSDRFRLTSPESKRVTDFVVTKTKYKDQELIMASDAGPLIKLEAELQRFIQTLTETFAHLPIGLAVFDKKRDLSLFNPALSDLLGVSADWLIRRPSLPDFVDQLRNDGALPEPKDFKSLRQQLINLENGSVAGSYNAEWTLPTGRIYKVIGRPHLKGGMALLFEDISKPVMFERRYRRKLGELYSAFDCLDQGIAIFSRTGELCFINSAFAEIWEKSLCSENLGIAAVEFSQRLQEKCRPSPAWGDFREFMQNRNERSLWQAQATKLSGEPVGMTFSPISGGRVFCEFRMGASLM